MPKPVKQPTAQSSPAYLQSDVKREKPRPTGYNPPFLFAWKPGCYEVSSGMVVPVIMRYRVSPGMNGTGAIRDRRGREVGVDVKGLRTNLMSWNKREIPHDVDGAGTSYMTQPVPGHYCDRWTTLYAGTDRRSFDQQGYDEWRASLITRGLVPVPRRVDLEQARDELVRTYDALTTRFASLPAAHQTESGKAEMSSLKGNIDALDIAMLDLPDEFEPLDSGPAVSVGA